ncbi:MAG: hypothetical protein QOH89_2264 [Pseudonocardiales bacterium]|jgi:hypothetical protein|nr:hypothetical protein [Pseudonocardiales bacterium]MDT4941470.1 hypothetical protein [Pseudonocardiales bacterium]
MPRTRSATAFARCAVAGAAVVTMSLIGAAPAQADTGSTGTYTGASCGWYPHTSSMLSLWDDKIVRINLPGVSAVSDGQLVWAHVQFAQPAADGSMAAYRDGWFYTYASPGQLTASWTSYQEGTPNWTYVEDAPGESGYVAGDVSNLSTSVFVSLYWMTGSTVTGSATEWAQNAGSVYHPEICNTGGTLF